MSAWAQFVLQAVLFFVVLFTVGDSCRNKNSKSVRKIKKLNNKYNYMVINEIKHNMLQFSRFYYVIGSTRLYWPMGAQDESHTYLPDASY
jgi:hypothetical protein